MKSILLSIKPKYVELIASGQKTIEVRKTAPKCETPFKCYIYMTQGKLKDLGIYSEWVYKNRMKVIGEFICDKASELDYVYYWNNGYEFETCLTYRQVADYGKGKTLYGWHISDLKIYDKPRELSDFYRECENPCKPNKGKILCITTKSLKMNGCNGKIPLTRAPQSWQYIEDLGEEK